MQAPHCLQGSQAAALISLVREKGCVSEKLNFQTPGGFFLEGLLLIL